MSVLPVLTEADPEVAGEGSLDPMRLAPIADRLADLLAPDVRARMDRIRFLTAISVGTFITQELRDEPPGDNVSTPQICFEWFVIEAFIREAKSSGALDKGGVPGSAKAHSVVRLQNGHLTARNYLKTPKVFGFHGVYNPLALGLGLIDSDKQAAEHTTELVRAWERDSDLPGFVDLRTSQAGGRLRRRLTDVVRASFRSGQCQDPTGRDTWKLTAIALSPNNVGTTERHELRRLLLDDRHPLRRELALLTHAARDQLDTEAAAVELEPRALALVLPTVSSELARRIRAVLAYEHFSVRLEGALRQLCYRSATQLGQFAPSDFEDDAVLTKCASEISGSLQHLREQLDGFDMQVDVERSFGEFEQRTSTAEFIEHTLRFHEEVQAGKGKQSWFAAYGRGWSVRPPYRHASPFEVDDRFIHPFRVAALLRFMKDTE